MRLKNNIVFYVKFELKSVVSSKRVLKREIVGNCKHCSYTALIVGWASPKFCGGLEFDIFYLLCFFAD